MKRVSTLVLVAMTLVLAASAWAQTPPEPPMQGTVVRVDQVERIVVLEDGRMVRIIETTEMMVDEKPATIMALEPGTRVIIRNGQVVTAAPAQTVVVTPSAAPAAIISVAPRDPWCHGAWDPTRGTNFGPCPKAEATR
jgi:hypothetical protein